MKIASANDLQDWRTIQRKSGSEFTCWFHYWLSKNTIILLKFIEIHIFTDEKVEELIKFIDEPDENSRETYLAYTQFDLLFFKDIKTKYDQMLNSFHSKLTQIKQNYNKDEEVLDQSKTKYEQIDKKN